MDAGELLVDTLTGAAAVMAIIGNNDSPETARLYPMVRLQDPALRVDLPAITFQEIFVNTNPSVDGDTAGLDQTRMQVDCWAKTHTAAMALADAVRTAMAAQTSTLLNRFPDYDDATSTYRVTLEFSIWVHTGD